jgi:protein involved in temperature-dependent protein secretion
VDGEKMPSYLSSETLRWQEHLFQAAAAHKDEFRLGKRADRDEAAKAGRVLALICTVHTGDARAWSGFDCIQGA